MPVRKVSPSAPVFFCLFCALPHFPFPRFVFVYRLGVPTISFPFAMKAYPVTVPRTLYHHPLSPPARLLRLALTEHAIPYELVLERFWEARPDFLKINPAGELPVLVENETILCGWWPAIEYVEETLLPTAQPLLGRDAGDRAEARRLTSWFMDKFHQEVAGLLLGEKVIRRLSGSGQPDVHAIRAGNANIHYHLDYIGWLMERRSFLAGHHLSLADLAAAAQLSVLDYLGDVPWADHPGAKDWYARMKSRPSFRPLLADHVAGLPPPTHYANLDF
jgi:glutathione S-transferase